jgi:hypothetical protein
MLTLDGIQMENCIQCKAKWFEMELDQEEACQRRVVLEKRKVMPPGLQWRNCNPGDTWAHIQMVMKRVQGHHTVTFLQDAVKFSNVLPVI